MYDYTFQIDTSLNKDDYTVIYQYTLTFQEQVEDSNTVQEDKETNNINIYIGGTDFTNQLYDFKYLLTKKIIKYYLLVFQEIIIYLFMVKVVEVIIWVIMVHGVLLLV